MRIAMRIDASRRIGIGHAMRCCALADAMANRGAHIRFICRLVPPSIQSLLASKGHEVVVLEGGGSPEFLDDPARAGLQSFSQGRDAVQSVCALADANWDWLIVDHYGLDAGWESVLREATVGRVMVIDDLADREHDCDVLLDQNLYSNLGGRYADRVSAKTQLLLGPKYALLRKEFRRLREDVRPRNGPVRRILVMFGGADSFDLTGRALEALDRFRGTDFSVDVVVGAEHPRRMETEAICAERGHACHVQTTRMAELMAAADLALGAGGSASWERCCLGLPSICASFADNQYAISEALCDTGACVFVGDQDAVTPAKFELEIMALSADPDRLKRMSSQAYSLVDGWGAERVCDALEGN